MALIFGKCEERKQIVELLNACNVSLIHRSHYYLLFCGDPAGVVYLEVELQRLGWL
ncbi:hypothetical protein KP509_18G014100 [Ceratopteris richardii]|uniref:NPK1-activating kinesin-like protein C-terminal domain-containing protein n=1 Tax=Ceratopteris richardii TaxID=49495 RepID=A0A8T2SMP8_CERRI|nr:hypothetical protein KP509_18G014100 [Ceratopteris richardii]